MQKQKSNLPHPYNQPCLKVRCAEKIFNMILGDTLTVEIALSKQCLESDFVDITIDPLRVGSILDGESPSGKKLIMSITYDFVSM